MCGKKKKKWVWTWPHYQDIEDGESGLSPDGGVRGLGGGGLSNMSAEQIKRDKKITRLLDAYIRFYEKKSAHSTMCRYLILIPCMAIICGCAFALTWLCVMTLSAEQDLDLEKLAAFITACAAFPIAIIGILHIITEYFFPKEDEKYITDIVKLVQKNDLKNRKESARFEEIHSDRDVSISGNPSDPEPSDLLNLVVEAPARPDSDTES